MSLDRSRHCILVVDDHPAARYTIVRSLQSAGYATLEAAGGANALELAEYASAVVLDVHLPDVFGTEVARLLQERKQPGRFPIIHVSAVHVSEADREAARRAGIDAYLTSPLDPEELVALLDRLLAPT